MDRQNTGHACKRLKRTILLTKDQLIMNNYSKCHASDGDICIFRYWDNIKVSEAQEAIYHIEENWSESNQQNTKYKIQTNYGNSQH